MRTYGRIPVDLTNPNGPKKWVVVTTDAHGFNDAVFLTALAQTLKLNLQESPFWASFGIPAKQAVLQQIYPDFYVIYTQQYYSQFFATLTIARQPTFEPTYDIFVTTHYGAVYGPIRIKGAPQ